MHSRGSIQHPASDFVKLEVCFYLRNAIGRTRAPKKTVCAVCRMCSQRINCPSAQPLFMNYSVNVEIRTSVSSVSSRPKLSRRGWGFAGSRARPRAPQVDSPPANRGRRTACDGAPSGRPCSNGGRGASGASLSARPSRR